MCAIIIIRMTLTADYPSQRSVIWISVKDDQIDREGWSVPLKYTLSMLETIPEVFPDTRYQCCTVHFYRNIFSVTPRNKMKTVALMLKAIHAQESKKAAREKCSRYRKNSGLWSLPNLPNRWRTESRKPWPIWIFLRSIGPGSGPITRLSVSTVRLNVVQKRSALFLTARAPWCSYVPNCVM